MEKLASEQRRGVCEGISYVGVGRRTPGKGSKQLVQRPWGNNGNEPTTITTLSQWGRAENRLVQAGLYTAFCTLGKSLLSLNAMGSHWGDSQERNSMCLTFCKGCSGCRREKGTRQVVGKGKPGARLQYLRGQAPSALDFFHCLQEAPGAPSLSYSSISAVVFFYTFPVFTWNFPLN